MMNKRIPFFLAILPIFVWLVACQSNASSKPTTTAGVLATQSPTAEPTRVVPTATVEATRTVTPSPTVIPSPIPSVTPSPTPIPTSTATPAPPLFVSQSEPHALSDLVSVMGYLVGGDIYDFTADERYVYLLLGGTLTVLDFHAPMPDRQVGYVLLTDVSQEVFIAGNFLYLWRNGEQNSILIVDISTPTEPRLVREYSGGDKLVAQQGTGVVYLQNELGMWWEMPASTSTTHDPIPLTTKPDLPPEATIPEAIEALFDEFTAVTKITNQPQISYAITSETLGARRLVAIDTRNPDQPRILATHESFGAMAHLVYGNGVLLGGGLGHAGGGLHHMDVTDPTQPTYIQDVPLASNGFATDGEYLFVGNGSGILTYKLSDMPLTEQGSYTAQTEGSEWWMRHRTHILLDSEQKRLMAVFGGDVGDGLGLEVVDAGIPTQLQTLSIYPPDLPQNPFLGIDDIAYSDHMLYVARDKNIHLFHVVETGQMENAGNLFFSQQTSHQIETNANVLYITDNDTDTIMVHVADVSDATQPTVVDNLPPCPINPNAQSHRRLQSDIHVSQNRLYWLTYGCGLQIFDISQPLMPILLETMPIRGHSLTVGDGLIFLQGIGQGIIVINSP